MTLPEGRRIGIFLLAGSRLLREALAKILNKKTDIAVVGADAHSSAAIEQIFPGSWFATMDRRKKILPFPNNPSILC
jgi:hypothetical protein